MKKRESKNITTLDKLLDNKYGKPGMKNRDKWEREFEIFRIGVLLEQARERLGLTQEELAKKCGTNKSYISRIENDGSDIRFSTLLRIIHDGFGGQIRLTLSQ